MRGVGSGTGGVSGGACSNSPMNGGGFCSVAAATAVSAAVGGAALAALAAQAAAPPTPVVVLVGSWMTPLSASSSVSRTLVAAVMGSGRSGMIGSAYTADMGDDCACWSTVCGRTWMTASLCGGCRACCAGVVGLGCGGLAFGYDRGGDYYRASAA